MRNSTKNRSHKKKTPNTTPEILKLKSTVNNKISTKCNKMATVINNCFKYKIIKISNQMAEWIFF